MKSFDEQIELVDISDIYIANRLGLNGQSACDQ